MRLLSMAAAGLLGLAACNQSPAQGAPADAAETQPAAPAATEAAAPDAVFERDKPAKATMSLTREGENWRVAFQAGGVPNGGATAADCELQAVGPQDINDAIAARVVPFEGDLNTVTASDIGAAPLVIQVRVGPEGVIVRDSGAAAKLCGLGSDIDGFYRRSGAHD